EIVDVLAQYGIRVDRVEQGRNRLVPGPESAAHLGKFTIRAPFTLRSVGDAEHVHAAAGEREDTETLTPAPGFAATTYRRRTVGDHPPTRVAGIARPARPRPE